ncbi:MAG: hypothetical protein O2819_00510 [Planctomycetota bacterium]|nr:hypothetical protein [Planctomycetota bacterium]MDA1105429.1 hypothetical protein [Planctomycetota bacterium]
MIKTPSIGRRTLWSCAQDITRSHLGTTAVCAIAAISAGASAGSETGRSEIYISEIRIDQPGTDTDEYIEIAGPPGASLDGLAYVVLGDGTAAQGGGTIEVAIQLAGHSIPASGFFVVAESSFTLGEADLTTTLNFENADNVTHLLVRGLTAANGTDLDTNDDCTLDFQAWKLIVDGVTMMHVDAGTIGAECAYQGEVGPSSKAVPQHIYRCRTTLWMIGIPEIAGGADSPGTANPCSSQACAPDLDADGAVAVADLAQLLAAWGFMDHQADFNLDGTVDGTDLNVLLGAWGPCA